MREKAHKQRRFRALYPFNSIYCLRRFSTNFCPKQTPKTPRNGGAFISGGQPSRRASIFDCPIPIYLRRSEGPASPQVADKHFILRVSLPENRRPLDMHELMGADDSIEFHCDGSD